MPNRHIWTIQKKNWAMSKWHWLLMMQPYDLPEKLLSSVPAEYYMKKKLSKTQNFAPGALIAPLSAPRSPIPKLE